jgi:ATP-binding cassette subfamily C exporter for protease/lipase
MFFSKNPKSLELRAIMKLLGPSVRHSFYITFAVTILSLGGVVYMMQVYDRIVSTRSMETLLSLTIAVLVAYAVSELLEVSRKVLLQRSTMRLEIELSERVFRAIHKANLMQVTGVHVQQMKDLGNVRAFLHSPGMVALLELPTSLFFLILMFVINPQMGYFSLLGLMVQSGVTMINATKVDPALRKAQWSAMEAMYYCYEIMRNSQVMHALGMSRNLENMWVEKQKKMMAEQAKASDTGGTVMAASKFIGQTQGSLLLGLGCMLSIYGLMDGGGAILIVASIIGGKALSPIMQILSSWKPMTEARMAFERLERLILSSPDKPAGMPLPPPKGNLTVDNLVLSAPGHPVPILRGLNFSLAAGNTLVVIGASGSGKSTLTRAVLGIWPAANGKVRLDGSDVYQWNKEELGNYIGYLPQDVDLFDGTVAENIARFGEQDLEHMQEICKLVNIHDTIMALPDGYQSVIGDDGVTFSGGQRQRIGMARAIYGYPKFIVMDEPNSNLDHESEKYLIAAMRHMKSLGSTQIIVTHRETLITEADFLMVMSQGSIQTFGPRADVLAAFQKAHEERKAANDARAAAQAAAQAAPQINQDTPSAPALPDEKSTT